MNCPKCGTNLTLVIADDVERDDGPGDPLAPVVRRLEAERYGPPIHETRPKR